MALERRTDAITHADRRIDQDGPAPTAEEVDAVAAGILDLGRAVRDRRPPGRSTLPRQPVLDDITGELQTAREVLSGPI